MVEFRIIENNSPAGKRRRAYYYVDGVLQHTFPSNHIHQVANFIYILTNAAMTKPQLTPEEEAYLEMMADWKMEERKLKEYLENYEEEEQQEEEEEEVLDYDYH